MLGIVGEDLSGELKLFFDQENKGLPTRRVFKMGKKRAKKAPGMK